MTAARVNKRLEKELNSRIRECMANERTHLRVGDWRRHDYNTEIHLIGAAQELHGPYGVCTCCPRAAS